MQAVTLFSRIAHVKDKKRSFKCDQFTFIVWSNRLIREAFRRQFRKLLPPAAILSRPAVLSARLSPVHCPLFQWISMQSKLWTTKQIAVFRASLTVPRTFVRFFLMLVISQHLDVPIAFYVSSINQRMRPSNHLCCVAPALTRCGRHCSTKNNNKSDEPQLLVRLLTCIEVYALSGYKMLKRVSFRNNLWHSPNFCAPCQR